MVEEYNKIQLLNNNNDLDITHINMIKYLTIDLSPSIYAYYFQGAGSENGGYSPEDIVLWFSETFELLQKDYPIIYQHITFADWLNKIYNGSLSNIDIKNICNNFHKFNECGAIFTYIKISKENNIEERIEETKKLLYEYATKNDETVNDEIVKNEALCHFYLNIGAYYIFGINLDAPFETYEYMKTLSTVNPTI